MCGVQQAAHHNRTRRVSDDEVHGLRSTAPAASSLVPNEETRRAMALAEAKAMGVIPDNDPSFTDADALMASLDAE